MPYITLVEPHSMVFDIHDNVIETIAQLIEPATRGIRILVSQASTWKDSVPYYFSSTSRNLNAIGHHLLHVQEPDHIPAEKNSVQVEFGPKWDALWSPESATDDPNFRGSKPCV
ncbi:hypothetical protein BGZ81_001474 [Podila clonocystis]|nr:hypothetical protein BGZ81_001474 [Podila clonocystis]